LFTLIQAELRRSGFEDLIAAGVVLTGGSSKMEGVIELAEEIFHAPVRLGIPQYVAGLADVVKNPIHATGVGLLLYGHQQRYIKRPNAGVAGSVKGIWETMRNWFQGNF